MGHDPHARGYRDGFWGRASVEADPSYLVGFRAGVRDGDRTINRQVAGSVANASATPSGLVSDPGCLPGGDEAALTPSETPEAP